MLETIGRGLEALWCVLVLVLLVPTIAALMLAGKLLEISGHMLMLLGDLVGKLCLPGTERSEVCQDGTPKPNEPKDPRSGVLDKFR